MTFLGSKPGRPVVGLDVDGTIAKYYEHFIAFAEQYLGTGLSVDWHPRHKGEFSDALEMDKQIYRDIKLAYRQGGLKRSIPLHYGATFLVNMIHDAGAEVWFCTTRPWQRLDNIDPDTRFFFDHNGLDYNGVIYGEDKYADLLEIVGPDRVVCVLDDLPEMVEEATRLGIDALLRQGPHNQWWWTTPGVVRVEHLGTAATLIVERINKWKEQHMSGPQQEVQDGEADDTMPAPSSVGPQHQHTMPKPDGGHEVIRICSWDAVHRAWYFHQRETQIVYRCTWAHDEDGGDDVDRGDFGLPALGSAAQGLCVGFPPQDGSADYVREIQVRPRRAGKSTEQFIAEVCNIFDEAQTLYKQKAKGYGTTANRLGVKGQIADMNRKWEKMFQMLWDESLDPFPDAPAEDVLQIIQDMMGHCALTIQFLRQSIGEDDRNKTLGEEGPYNRPVLDGEQC